MSELPDNIKDQINIAAYFLAKRNHTYDQLCWLLAQRHLIAQKDPNYKQEQRIKEKAAEIYFWKTPYDVLCYLIAELDIMIKLGKV